MKKAFALLIPLSLSLSLTALPSQGKVISGEAAFKNVNPTLLQIVTSDKAIINYTDFNIGEKEKVQFIQPSKDASVLNRITSKNPSQILGSLEANGKVFLVNPNGIYFGKDASVNTGAFLASTLNISDKDFLNGAFSFTTLKNSTSSIVNEGSLSSPEGFITLLAPTVENKGSVIAESGRILIGSAEKITLDFSGDGLMKFSLDGELEKALIENGGLIKAQDGSVNLSLKAANKAIKMTVNTDGITPANHLEEVSGLIVLSAKGTIKGDVIHIEGQDGSAIQISGALDVSNIKDTSSGGSIKILGDQISLKGASIEASGNAGGGEILIGGDYKGEGSVRNAKNTVVDEGSTIQADALVKGNGGRVILWSDGVTLFNGKISTMGGLLGGDGGFVETSGKKGLGIAKGNVSLLAAKGEPGTWLLDPTDLYIVTSPSEDLSGQSSDQTLAWSRATTDNSYQVYLTRSNSGFSTPPDASIGKIVLYANSSIWIGLKNTDTLITPYDLVFMSSKYAIPGNFRTKINTSIQAKSITFTSAPDSSATNDVAISVYASKAITLTATGGDITFGGKFMVEAGTAPSVTLSATGTVNMKQGTGGTYLNGVPSSYGLPALMITAQTIKLGSNIFTAVAPINLTGNVILDSNTIFDTRASSPTVPSTNPAGADIIINGQIDGTSSGNQTLSLISGTSGSVTLAQPVGSSNPLQGLAVQSKSINQQKNVNTVGDVSYSCTNGINLSGNITTSGLRNSTNNTAIRGAINFSGPVTLNTPSIGGAIKLDTTSSSPSVGQSSGANISCTSTIDSTSGTNVPLSLKAGAGSITLSDNLGATQRLGAVEISSASNNIYTIQTLKQPIKLSGGPITIAPGRTLDTTSPQGAGDASNSNIICDHSIDGGSGILLLNCGGVGSITFGDFSQPTKANKLILTAGTVTQNCSVVANGGVNYAVGNTTLCGNITTTGGTLSLSGAIRVNSASEITLSTTGDTGTGTDTSPGGPINITASLDSALGQSASVKIKGGTGAVTVTKDLGVVLPLKSISITGSSIDLKNVGTLSIPGASSFTATASGVLNFNGNIYNGGTQSYTAPANTSAANFVLTNVNPSQFIANDKAIAFNGGTISQKTGAPLDFTVNAGQGNFNFVQIGTPSLPFNTVSLTAAAMTPKPNNVPLDPARNIYAATLNQTNTGIVVITQDQTIGQNGVTTLTYNAPVVINKTGPITISSDTNPANNIIFNDTLDAGVGYSPDLIIQLHGNNVEFDKAVGSSSPLHSLTINAAASTPPSSVSINAPISAGSFQQTGTIATNLLNGSITTTGGAISFAAPISLQSSATLSTDGAQGSDITLNQVDGANGLSLNAGGSGKIVLSGNIGQTTPLSSLTFSGAKEIDLGANVSVNNDLVFGLPLYITNDAVITAGTNPLKNITLNSTIDSATTDPKALSLQGSLVEMKGTVGGLNPLKELDITGSSIHILNSLISAQKQTYTGPVNVGTDSTFQTPCPAQGDIVFNDTLDVDPALASAPKLDFQLCNNSLFFKKAVGSASSSDWTSRSIDSIKVETYANSLGPKDVMIGDTMRAKSFTQTSGSGKTTVSKDMTTMRGINITSNGIALSSSAGTANITSDIGSIQLNGAITLEGDTSLKSMDQGIFFTNSSIDGNHNLSVNAGPTGSTTLPVIGASNPIGSLTVNAGRSVHTNLFSKIKNFFSVSDTPSVAALGGNITTNGGKVDFICPMNLNTDVTIATTGNANTGADITFELGVRSADYNLTLDPGNQAANLPILNTTNLKSFRVKGDAKINVNASGTDQVAVLNGTNEIIIEGHLTGTSGGPLVFQQPSITTLQAPNVSLNSANAQPGLKVSGDLALSGDITGDIKGIEVDGNLVIPSGKQPKLITNNNGRLVITGSTQFQSGD